MRNKSVSRFYKSWIFIFLQPRTQDGRQIIRCCNNTGKLRHTLRASLNACCCLRSIPDQFGGMRVGFFPLNKGTAKAVDIFFTNFAVYNLSIDIKFWPQNLPWQGQIFTVNAILTLVRDFNSWIFKSLKKNQFSD